jgi:hypothetical protein
MSDSKRDPLMQLADMCIGAITRACARRETSPNRRQATRSPGPKRYYLHFGLNEGSYQFGTETFHLKYETGATK